MSDNELSFEGSTNAEVTPKACSELTKDDYVVIMGRPCKIVELSTSKPGKHGASKVHIVGIDIFTGKKLEDISPATHQMDVPEVVHREFKVTDIDDDGRITLDDDSTVQVPEGDIGQQITGDWSSNRGLNVTVVYAMGEEAVVSCRESDS